MALATSTALPDIPSTVGRTTDTQSSGRWERVGGAASPWMQTGAVASRTNTAIHRFISLLLPRRESNVHPGLPSEAVLHFGASATRRTAALSSSTLNTRRASSWTDAAPDAS